MTIAIVGRGRLGKGLAKALVAAGLRARLVSGRALSEGRPLRGAARAADLFVLAVPDPHVTRVAASLASCLDRRARVMLHVSGALRLDALEPARRAGHEVGAMHPLVSFASSDAPPPLEGTTFVLAGSPRARRAASALARAVGARTCRVPAHGPRYHAAAALAANGAAALAALAVELLEGEGFSRRVAERAIGGLLATVAYNVARVGVPAALTGPVVRGDVRAVEAHRAALAGTAAQHTYDALGPLLVDVAAAAGLSNDAARALRRVFATPAVGEHRRASGVRSSAPAR